MSRSYRIGSTDTEALGVLFEQMLRDAGFKVLCERGGDSAIHLAGSCSLWLLDPTPLWHESHVDLIHEILGENAYSEGIALAVEAARAASP